jgi:hypothetical protein
LVAGGRDLDRLAALRRDLLDLAPQLSPDGRAVVYCADYSGKDEIYLQSFPSGQQVPREIVVVENWYEEFRDRER